MPPSTDQLIARLAASAQPVRRLRPPLLRALFFLIGVAAVGAVAAPLYADFGLFARHLQDWRSLLELIGTLLTGIAAVIAAFELSLPDRSPAWAWLPIPPLILWLASSGYNCWRDWIEYGNGVWHLGESAACFGTIVGFSIPLGAALLFFPRARCRSRRCRWQPSAAWASPASPPSSSNSTTRSMPASSISAGMPPPSGWWCSVPPWSAAGANRRRSRATICNLTRRAFSVRASQLCRNWAS